MMLRDCLVRLHDKLAPDLSESDLINAIENELKAFESRELTCNDYYFVYDALNHSPRFVKALTIVEWRHLFTRDMNLYLTGEASIDQLAGHWGWAFKRFDYLIDDAKVISGDKFSSIEDLYLKNVIREQKCDLETRLEIYRRRAARLEKSNRSPHKHNSESYSDEQARLIVWREMNQTYRYSRYLELIAAEFNEFEI